MITKEGAIKHNKKSEFLCIENNNKFTRIEKKVELISKIDDGINPDRMFNPDALGLGKIKDHKITHYKFDSANDIEIYIKYPSIRNITLNKKELFNRNKLFAKVTDATRKTCHNESISTKEIRAKKRKQKQKEKEKINEFIKKKSKKTTNLNVNSKTNVKLKPKPKNHRKDVMIYIKVASSINSEKQQLIIKKLHKYIHNRKYRNVYLTFSEKYRNIKYEGNDSSLYHLYKADNSSVRRDRNYEFDIPALLETDTKRYKDIIVFDYLTSCRNNYAKNVTIVNIDDNTCEKKSEDRIIDLMSSN
jgi:hypothetical protein